MWSVVTESPRAANARAARIGRIGPGSAGKSTKNGGSWTYVLAGSQANNSLSATGKEFHVSLAVEDVAVAAGETFPAEPPAPRPRQPPPALGQMSLQVDRPAVAADAQRLGGQVDVRGAGQGIGDDQRRAGQVVRLDQRIDAALEIAVAAQDRRGHEVPLADGRGHRLGQRPAVADARRAAVADGVEAQLVQRLVQPGLVRR